MPIFNLSRRPDVQRLLINKDIDGLIDALGYQDDHNIRLDAASALGRIGDEKAVDPLIIALDDEPRVREVSAKALGEIGDPRAVDSLISMLDNADWEIRGTIAKALGKIGDPGAINTLIDLLQDKRENVRWYATQALENITSETFGDDVVMWKQKFMKRG
jgi:HEAT repeat protein